MPILFNALLQEAGLPPTDVRLIRHKDKRAARGRTPCDLWRDNRSQFELYQSTQSIRERGKLTAPYWAVFIVNFNNETMFAGVYAVQYRGLLERDTPKPHMDGIDEAGSCDVYDLTLQEALSDLIGKLFIDWGSGALAWIQYAHRNNKPVTELRVAFQEPAFPGFLNFIEPLSKLDNLPKSWNCRAAVVSWNLLADLSEDQGAVCRLRDRRRGILGPLAKLRSNRPRRQCRSQEPRPQRLPDLYSGGRRNFCDRRRHPQDGRTVAVKAAKPGHGIELELGGSGVVVAE